MPIYLRRFASPKLGSLNFRGDSLDFEGIPLYFPKPFSVWRGHSKAFHFCGVFPASPLFLRGLLILEGILYKLHKCYLQTNTLALPVTAFRQPSFIHIPYPFSSILSPIPFQGSSLISVPLKVLLSLQILFHNFALWYYFRC